MFPNKRTESELRQLNDEYVVKHICIDDDIHAHYGLLLLLAAENKTLADVDKVYGYRCTTSGTARSFFLFLGPEDHAVMQQIIGETKPCQLTSN